MTEYTDKVRLAKFKLDAEKWGRDIVTMEFEKFVITTEYLSLKISTPG